MKKDKKNKYRIDASNKYAESITNPTVQPNGKTQMGIPIPSDENVEYSKEYGEEHEV